MQSWVLCGEDGCCWQSSFVVAEPEGFVFITLFCETRLRGETRFPLKPCSAALLNVLMAPWGAGGSDLLHVCSSCCLAAGCQRSQPGALQSCAGPEGRSCTA